MNRAGWIGILVIGAGVLMIWSGYTGVDPLEALRSILRNEPLPDDPDMAPATPGSSGGSGFDEDTNGAGQGAGGGSGGGW